MAKGHVKVISMTTTDVHMLVATDVSNAVGPALDAAIAFARARGARLHVWYALPATADDLTRLLADATAHAGPGVSVTVSSMDTAAPPHPDLMVVANAAAA